MNCNLPKITYPTLRSLLLLKICEAISLWKDVQVANHSIENSFFPTSPYNSRVSGKILILKKVKSETSVVAYSSSIALRLGAESQQKREEIADQIAHFLQSSPSKSSVEDAEMLLLRDITVRQPDPGRLVFELSDRAIATYLQKILTDCVFQPIEMPNKPSFSANRNFSGNSEIFLCQYSYARCAALMRLESLPNHIGKSVENDSAIWLKNSKLLLQKELNLLAAIVTTLDEWEEKSPLKLATALSEAFQQFYRDCQIVKYDTINLQVAQCRLALVMITHWLLKQLLETGLGVVAPETL